MTKAPTVAIHQPNYLPWLGYFRKIARADVFVFFDNVQMPMGKSFVTRNRILTEQGPRWLTVPVERSGTPHGIVETRIADRHWEGKHLKTLDNAYAHSPWLPEVSEALRPALSSGHEFIADLNVDLIQRLCALLGIDGVRFRRASDMALGAGGAASIPDILGQTEAAVYLTGAGTGSRRHLDIEALRTRGIKTEIISSKFSEYPQRHGRFEPNLSIIDALLSCGPDRTRALLDEA